MIFAKTKMTRIPETCKKCSMSKKSYDCFGYKDPDKRCFLTGLFCPKEKKESGNIGYGKPDWCPLMDLEIVGDGEDE